VTLPPSSGDRFDLRSEARSDVPGTILVALDGSPFAESALAHARPLARALGSGLHLLTVLDPSRTGATSRTSAEARLQRLEAATELSSIADSLRDDGYQCTFEVREGQPSSEIVASMAERRVGAIALAARPRSTAERLTPGSITAGILRAAMPSLLVARGKAGGRLGARGGARPEVRYRRIGVAVDGSHGSHRALRLASSLAREDDAEIVLVHVLASAAEPEHPATSGSESARGIPFQEASEALRYLRVVERKLSLHGVPVRSRLFYSWPEADAVQGDADLLVIAAGGGAIEARGDGRSARRLLLHGRIPVLAFREAAAAPPPSEPWTPGRAASASMRTSQGRREAWSRWKAQRGSSA